ncbi:MAG: nitroreductase family deazaflavin-dependent oxidoreductase [Actinomycetota bacterium]|nr:nitroreductase family deazaflavin-dependent oxidoreductase [Actinomycetota bacterium]
MADRNDWNRAIIEEFRQNDGRVGDPFEHQPLLLLHHRGAKSGVERLNPLAYQELENGYAVFASKGGAPTNPDWYHDLVANPRARVEVGTDTVDVVARVAKDEERERIWQEQKRRNPGFEDYEVKTSRQIPVVILERVPSGGSESSDRHPAME